MTDVITKVSIGGQVYPFGQVDTSVAAEDVSYDNTTSGMTATNVQDAIDEVFQSVSNGKTLIAAAITDKGVQTAASDSFSTMATNIGLIPAKQTVIGQDGTIICNFTTSSTSVYGTYCANNSYEVGIVRQYQSSSVSMGVFFVKDPTGNIFTQDAGQPRSSTSKDAIYVDNDGNYYIYNTTGGYEKFDVTTKEFSHYTGAVTSFTNLTNSATLINVSGINDIYTKEYGTLFVYNKVNNRWFAAFI